MTLRQLPGLLVALALGLGGCASTPPRASEACQACEENRTLCECQPAECCASGGGDCACCAGRPPSGPSEREEPSAKPEPEEGPSYVYKGPERLDPAECGIGALVDDAEFVDLAGEVGSLRALTGRAQATIVLFTGLGCPVTKAYAPSLEAKTRAWRKRGVEVLVVSPAILDTPAALRAWGKRHGWTFRVVLDRGFALTAALGGRRTADAFLLDREGRLRYRGPLDDQYGINLRLPQARTHLLDDALNSLLAGDEIPNPALEAPGCKITRVEFEEDE